MAKRRAVRLILIGSGLVIAGWVLPFLMVLRVLEPSFPLVFFSYAALLCGMGLGLVGAVQHRIIGRDDDEG